MGFEGGNEILWRPFTLTDQCQGADEIAHLVMQERPSLSPHMHLIAGARDIQAIQCLDRAIRLAVAGPEAREIMISEQALSGRMHLLGIDIARDEPDPSAIQRRR